MWRPLTGFVLHIGDRATLAPLAGETAWGVALPSDEVAQLYGAPSVADYRPKAALARKKDGETVAALSTCRWTSFPARTRPMPKRYMHSPQSVDYQITILLFLSS